MVVIHIDADDKLNEVFKHLKDEISRPKQMVTFKTDEEKLQYIITNLKQILDSRGNEYKLDVKSTLPTDKVITVEITEFFGTTQKNHNLFKDLIQFTDGFSIVPIDENSVRLYFSIRDFSTET